MKTKHLTDYLNLKFPTSIGFLPEDLISHFLTEFGVDVKIEAHTDNKFLFGFKYSMLGAKWMFPITHECRGIILRNSNDGWEIMSHPFNKFFNQHEGHCPIFKEEDFNKRTYELYFAEKCDGTAIQLWNDPYLNKWRVSTLGTITTMVIHDSGTTFDDLFWRIAPPSLKDFLAPGNTYLFELCSKLNRVVTRYPKDCIYILGVRINDSELLADIQIRQHFTPLLSDTFMMTAKFPLEVADVFTLKQAQDWVEKQAGNRQFGEYAEGFVIYDAVGPVCKMKNSVYLALHHSLSDAACTRNAVIASFFKGSMDDLYAALPEEFQRFADKLKDWLNDFRNYLDTQVAEPFHHSPFPTRKDYALYVQALPEREKMFRGFFFSNQEGVCDPKKSLSDLFTSWISENYEKYEDYWKKME